MSAVLGQRPDLALLFALIFGLNLIPAFAPTWMALALVGFQYHDTRPGIGCSAPEVSNKPAT